jgi:hypothetical protein
VRGATGQSETGEGRGLGGVGNGEGVGDVLVAAEVVVGVHEGGGDRGVGLLLAPEEAADEEAVGEDAQVRAREGAEAVDEGVDAADELGEGFGAGAMAEGGIGQSPVLGSGFAAVVLGGVGVLGGGEVGEFVDRPGFDGDVGPYFTEGFCGLPGAQVGGYDDAVGLERLSGEFQRLFLAERAERDIGRVLSGVPGVGSAFAVADKEDAAGGRWSGFVLGHQRGIGRGIQLGGRPGR